MASTKKLNGLPNSLEQRFFSTPFFYGNGYMADWILHTARQNNVESVNIDIINDKVIPDCMEIKPIVAYLPELRQTIDTTLTSNDFTNDFIIKANFQIDIPKDLKNFYLNVKCITVDKNGKVYEGQVYSERAYELRPNFIDKIKKLFTKT